jgi:heat shock transcription factor
MTGMNLDPSLLNTTIGSLLQSPAAAQMFFNSLNASVQGQALQHPKPAAPSPPLSGVDSDPTMALFSPLPSGLQSQNQDLISAYQKALNVNQDVGDLQDSIDSLVRSMGLDLPNGATPTATPATTATTAPSTAAPGTADGAFDDPNFNVDEFLDQLAKDGTDQ